MRGHRDDACCAGCGIPLSDGYVVGCDTCTTRRTGRLRRGELTTPTGYANEVIDNVDRRGRIRSAVGYA